MWNPTRFVRLARVVETSTLPARVRTDAGDAHIKVMGNPRGEHVLAADLIGTRIAALLGLPTFDVAILYLEPCDGFELGNGSRSLPGPAFATRTVPGHAWGGATEELQQVVNPDDAALLVVADTLLRNPDRHPRRPPPPGRPARRVRPDNVFLSTEGLADGRLRIVAMDFTECLTAGREITRKVGGIENERDEGVYGLFDEFRPLMSRAAIDRAAGRLVCVTHAAVHEIVESVPREWQLTPEARDAAVGFISARASWMSDRIAERLTDLCQPQRELFGLDAAGSEPSP